MAIIDFISIKHKSQKNILFDKKDDWQANIEKHIDKTKYAISFCWFNQIKCFNKYELIIPLTIFAQNELNSHFKHCKNKRFFCPNNQTIELANDKYEFNKYLINNGYSKYIPGEPIKDEYPYILKTKKGEFGNNCYIIRNNNDEKKFTQYLDDKDNYYKQLLVEGNKEYTTHIFCYKKIRFHCT